MRKWLGKAQIQSQKPGRVLTVVDGTVVVLLFRDCCRFGARGDELGL